jgi:hypothetical protein
VAAPFIAPAAKPEDSKAVVLRFPKAKPKAKRARRRPDARSQG